MPWQASWPRTASTSWARRASGEEAIAKAGELKPDLVLLDLSMPEMDGLTALPRVRAAAPEAEVVVLTASEDEHNLLGAIRSGAAGYLLKSEPPERIVAFLRGVAQGEAALSGPIARRLLDQVREGGGRSSIVPESIAQALSARELEVLLLLDRHLGTDEIAHAPLHLRAHRALAREEPAREARRLVAPRGARAPRRAPLTVASLTAGDAISPAARVQPGGLSVDTCRALPVDFSFLLRHSVGSTSRPFARLGVRNRLERRRPTRSGSVSRL